MEDKSGVNRVSSDETTTVRYGDEGSYDIALDHRENQNGVCCDASESECQTGTPHCRNGSVENRPALLPPLESADVEGLGCGSVQDNAMTHDDSSRADGHCCDSGAMSDEEEEEAFIAAERGAAVDESSAELGDADGIIRPEDDRLKSDTDLLPASGRSDGCKDSCADRHSESENLEMTVSDGDADMEVKAKDLPPHLPPKTPTMIHPGVDPPLCASCTSQELSFFDPACPDCRQILLSPSTTVPDIFAIMRQWTPQTQQNLELLVDEILKRGANINDRDGLTDMTLLHYASKSGAAGIGDSEAARRIVSMLIDAGADVNVRCRWTNMAALHYASYFDVVPVLKILLKASKALDIDSTCSEFEHGTSLHIAASNLAHDACKLLLQTGATPNLKDDLGRKPIDCIPDEETFEKDSNLCQLVTKLKKLLSEALPPTPKTPPLNYDLVQSKVTLQALRLGLGDRIVVGGVKSGILRYCGPTEFATGIWAGVELDEPAGKNNGSVGGFSYFSCANNHGIFAPISKINKVGAAQRSSTPPAPRRYSMREMTPVDVSRVTAKVDTGLNRLSPMESDIEVNDKVIVAGQRKGTVRFIGETQFAPGLWFGVELDRPVGKNDGSVNGVSYFKCRSKHGVFAPLTRIQKLGDKRFSSNESLDTISWGAVSERVDRRSSSSMANRSRTPTRPSSGRALSLSRVPGQSPGQALEVGVTVLCNNELGVVRYMGPTHFGDGTWLGVELRKPKGKNDGSVQGKRYFACPPDHGLLVKPSRVTVRGINGAKILAEQTSMAAGSSGSGSRSLRHGQALLGRGGGSQEGMVGGPSVNGGEVFVGGEENL